MESNLDVSEGSYQTQNHIFNAGPLVEDDQADPDSDYEDYFDSKITNRNQRLLQTPHDNEDEVHDEEIVIDTQTMIKDISTLRKHQEHIYESEEKI